MTHRYLTVNGEDLTKTDNKNQMIKTYSFTTDDDDASSTINSQAISNHDKLLSVNSPSMDSVNNDELSEASTSLKRRKPRRHMESENSMENKRSSIKKRLWHIKIDWSKLLMVVSVLIFLYLSWIKRDIWIPRLLTSNSRIRRSIITKEEQTTKELTNSSSSSPTTITTISSKDSSPDSSHKEDIIENAEENNNDQNNIEEINSENNDDSTSSSTKSSNAQKINIRVRRNKVRFSKDRQEKKRRHLRDSSIDDDVDEDEDKPIKSEESILPLPNNLPKKHHHRSVISNENLKSHTPINSNLRLSTYDDIVDQLRKNLKSRSRDREFLSTISKTTGLNKNKLYRFIYKKDYQLLTLQTFISLLDTFNLMLLIVPK